MAKTIGGCAWLALVLAAGCGEGAPSAPPDAAAPPPDAALDAAPPVDAAPDAAPREAMLVIDPARVDFGAVLVGGRASATLMVRNRGERAAGALTAATSDSMFSVEPTCVGRALAPGAGCDLVVVFAPAAAGARGAALELGAGPGGTLSVPLEGVGLLPARLDASPASFDFGEVDVGRQSAPLTWRVTNRGDLATGVPQLGGGGAFTARSGCVAALAPGAACDIEIRFAPTQPGAQSASMTLAAAPGGSVTLALAGSGRALWPLSVATGGNAGGSVTGPGIDCGSDCTESYPPGTEVLLTAAAPDGADVTWTGCTSAGPGSCAVRLDAATTVTVTFTLRRYPLRLSATGNAVNAGDVTSTPAGVSCPGTCLESYDHGTVVTLRFTDLYPGVTALAWTGCTSAAGPECTVVMQGPRMVSLTATLPGFPLGVRVDRLGSGAAAGRVTGRGIECDAPTTGDCDEVYAYGSTVTLQGRATVGALMWTGCPRVVGQSCQVTVTGPLSLAASVRAERLSIAQPSTCYVSAPGINCGGGNGRDQCTRDYEPSALVTLHVSNLDGDFWSFATCPGGTAGTDTCTTTMSDARLITLSCGRL